MSPTLDRMWYFIILLVVTGSATIYGQTESFTITLDQPTNGKVALSPALPPEGKYPSGTKLTVTATPDAGLCLRCRLLFSPGTLGGPCILNL